MPKKVKDVTPSALPSSTSDEEAVGGSDTVNADDGTPFRVFTSELVSRVYWTADARNPDLTDGVPAAAVDMAAHTRIYYELVDEWRRGNFWDERWGLIPGRLWTHQAPPPPAPAEDAPAGGGGTTHPRRRSARLSAAAGSSVGRAAAPAPVKLPPYNPFAAKARERSAGGTVTLSVGRELIDGALESPFDYLRDGLGVAAARRRSELLRKLHLGAEAEAEAEKEEEKAGNDPAAAAETKAKTKTRRDTAKRALGAEESPGEEEEDEDSKDNTKEGDDEDNIKKAESRPKR